MPTADGQYHTDEFIGEIIKIGRLRRFEITIEPDMSDPDERVYARIEIDHILANLNTVLSFHGSGKTMGFALADVREQIRESQGV